MNNNTLNGITAEPGALIHSCTAFGNNPDILKVSSDLFGQEFAKKFANTGLLAIYYALKIIKPRNLWIIGLEFYQNDYLERRTYHPPIEVLQDKMKRVNAVGVANKWIKEHPNITFNILSYFNGFKPQRNLRLL